MNLTAQVKILRQIVRLTLPEYEASAGMFPLEIRPGIAERVKYIRKFLRDTTPRKKK